MNRSWVRFPQAAQIRPPGSGWAFLHARVVLLVAPRVFRAPEGPAAREARASLRSAPRLEARPCPPDPPAPSTPVGPGVLACGLARRLEARPGPAAAHGRCSLVLRTPQCGLACRAGIVGRSAVCCYKRRQSEVFFLWISDPLLQTSSIRRLFR